jgi:hypothetical protein
MWAYGTIYSCQPEEDLYVLLLPAVFVVIPGLYTLLLQVRERACSQLKACSRACLTACMIVCLIACLRELRFEWSRVFNRKLLADGKL